MGDRLKLLNKLFNSDTNFGLSGISREGGKEMAIVAGCILRTVQAAAQHQYETTMKYYTAGFG